MATVFSSPNVVKCLQVSPFYLVRSGMEREQCRSPTSWDWDNLSEISQALFVVHVAGCCGKKKYFHASCLDRVRHHWCQSVMCWWNMQWRRVSTLVVKHSLNGYGAMAPSIDFNRRRLTAYFISQRNDMQILGFPPLVLISDPSPAAIAGHPPSPLLCNWKCPWTPLPYRDCNNAGDKRLCISHPTMSDPMTVIRSG